MPAPSPLGNLPVELIYEIQLCTLSDSLPIINRRFHDIFQATPLSYRAKYIFLRYLTRISLVYTQGQLVTFALTFPLCTEHVLDTLLRLYASEPRDVEQGPRPSLPKRLFKYLDPRMRSEDYTYWDPPLPFLHYLYEHGQILPPDPNAHDGYALVRAVHAGHTALVAFLLDQGANPGLKDALAVRIAIKKRDLVLVKMLVERDAEETYEIYYYSPTYRSASESSENDSGRREDRDREARRRRKKRRTYAKRRRVEDRVEVTTALLRIAVETDARDIVQYFLDKGARPDLLTIQRMRRIGFI